MTPAIRAQAQMASASPVALVWRAPPAAQCSSAEQIRTKVAKLSDQPLTLIDGSSGYRIEVVVAQSGDRWRADLRVIQPNAQMGRAREVWGRTPSCSSIDVAAIVVIATMLDNLRRESTDPGELAPPQPLASPGRLGLGVFAAANSQLIPEAWLGGGLAIELGTAIQLTVSASMYAPAEYKDDRARGVRLWGFHAGAALCPAAVRSDIVELHLCAGVQAGAVLASGIGLTHPADVAVPLVFGQAGPKLTLRVTRSFAVQLAASAAFAFVRPKIAWDIEGRRQELPTGGQIALLTQLGVTISPW